MSCRHIEKTLDEKLQAWAERTAHRLDEERRQKEERQRHEAERLRQDYLRRTGRREVRP